MCVSLSVWVCPFGYLSVRLSVRLFASVSVYASVCASVSDVRLFVGLSVRLFVSVSLRLSLCPSLRLSLCLCLFLGLSLSLFLFLFLFVCFSLSVSFCLFVLYRYMYVPDSFRVYITTVFHNGKLNIISKHKPHYKAIIRKILDRLYSIFSINNLRTLFIFKEDNS